MSILIECCFCGKKVNRYRSQINNNNFCSYDCFQSYRKSRTLNHDFFEKIDNQMNAYWLGFLYADGNISNKNRKQKSINLTLSRRDKKHVELFASIFGSNVRDYSRIKNEKECLSSVCSVTSEKLWNDLNSKGLKPNKTYINEDHIIDYVPRNLINHFIRGFFDGDGGISINIKTGGSVFHMVGLYNFLERLRVILQENCLLSDGNIFSKQCSNDIHMLEWGGALQLRAISNFLYRDAEIFLERKKNRFEKVINKYENFVKKRGCSFRGVYKSWNKFYSSIYYDKKSHYLGAYDNEIDAARAYDAEIIKLNKPRYKLNFLNEKNNE